MITALKIERFKSIKHLELQCRRINVFIGEPNTGKSNILEALGLVSWCGPWGAPLEKFVRFMQMHHLFYDTITDEPVRIECQAEGRIAISLSLERDKFVLKGDMSEPGGGDYRDV